ncbi:MAG: hypothetical protein ACQEUT_16170 [Bacillota bacterium]
MKNRGFSICLMTLMYAMWLPIPIAIYKITDSELLIVGSIFGIGLSMQVITMISQTGHYRSNREVHGISINLILL